MNKYLVEFLARRICAGMLGTQLVTELFIKESNMICMVCTILVGNLEFRLQFGSTFMYFTELEYLSRNKRKEDLTTDY